MTPKYIIIHHSASPITQTAESINAYHKSKWNFKSSIGGYAGYHYIIEHTGRLTQWRADSDVGAHCTQENMNYQSLGICIVGWFDDGHDSMPTQAQQETLRELLQAKMTQYAIPLDNIKFHRDYAPKSCPGQHITKDWINNLFTPMEKTYYIKSDLRNALERIWDDFDHEKKDDHEKMGKKLDDYLDQYNRDELEKAVMQGVDAGAKATKIDYEKRIVALNQASNKEEDRLLEIIDVQSETINSLEDDVAELKAKVGLQLKDMTISQCIGQIVDIIKNSLK